MYHVSDTSKSDAFYVMFIGRKKIDERKASASPVFTYKIVIGFKFVSVCCNY